MLLARPWLARPWQIWTHWSGNVCAPRFTRSQTMHRYAGEPDGAGHDDKQPSTRGERAQEQRLEDKPKTYEPSSGEHVGQDDREIFCGPRLLQESSVGKETAKGAKKKESEKIQHALSSRLSPFASFAVKKISRDADQKT